MDMEEQAFYGNYFELLQTVERTMLGEIRRLLADIPQEEENATAAEHLSARLKTARSCKEKLKRLGLPETPKAALEHLSDVVGVRVVTHFVGDVYAVLEQMQQSPSFEIVKIKDYIAAPKPNGYRSLHVILYMPFREVKGEGQEDLPRIQTEVQLRTIAMDCWASLEHQLRYKKHIQNAALIESELLRCAEEMASTDLSMQTIREMIRRG